jgi:hypothetical protein
MIRTITLVVSMLLAFRAMPAADDQMRQLLLRSMPLAQPAKAKLYPASVTIGAKNVVDALLKARSAVAKPDSLDLPAMSRHLVAAAEASAKLRLDVQGAKVKEFETCEEQMRNVALALASIDSSTWANSPMDTRAKHVAGWRQACLAWEGVYGELAQSGE